jgi:hypothetical protein
MRIYTPSAHTPITNTITITLTITITMTITITIALSIRLRGGGREPARCAAATPPRASG